MSKDCSTCACCKVCDHDEYGFETCNNWIPKWISVKDSLPMPFESVLVHVPNEHPLRIIREGFVLGDGTWRCGMFYITDPCEVTHWMPLPEPPEVSEDE